MDKAIPKLPDAELELMQAIWKCKAPVSRTDIEHIINAGRPLAATTILTMLARLTQKGALTVEKQGKSNIYTPVFSRRDYIASQSGRFFSKLCGGDIHLFAAALCDSGLSRTDIDELRRLLENEEI